MKKNDFLVLTAVVVILLPFFLSDDVLEAYHSLNRDYAYTMSFIKFAILATFGECLGLRIRHGVYWRKGFGLIPRAIVWGFLGMTIKAAFVVFGIGGPTLLTTLGVEFPTARPEDVLALPGFSWIKLLASFSVGVTLNLFFAPVFMTFHRITDMHIMATGGTVKGFFTPIRFARYFQEIDWYSMWNFVFKKTLILFWIPAQTLNFMFPDGYRILIAAFYGVILGVIMSLASLMSKKRL